MPRSTAFLHHCTGHFLGRDAELRRLDQAGNDDTDAFGITAWGGVGKTALIAEWMQPHHYHRRLPELQDAEAALLA